MNNIYYSIILKTIYNEYNIYTYASDIEEDTRILIQGSDGNITSESILNKHIFPLNPIMFVDYKNVEAYVFKNRATKFKNMLPLDHIYCNAEIIQIEPKFSIPKLEGYVLA